MNLAILRVTGSNAALSALANSISLNLDAKWKMGEARTGGGAEFKESGFNATIADVDTPAKLVSEIADFINKCESLGLDFSAEGISSQLDIGIGVGSPNQFAVSFTLPISLLSSLVSLGIVLCISAYPVSDDES